jgi:hypothetical protein
MQSTNLEQVQQLVDQLDFQDQARLLAYLTPRITRSGVADKTQRRQPQTENLPQEWRDLFRIGDAIAAQEIVGEETLTTAVTAALRANARSG